jgi:hypothetical protein
MIVVLIAAGELTSVSERVLAARLEARNPGLHVDVVDADTRPAAGGTPDACDLALERSLELEPAAVGICCTPHNAWLVERLGDRLRQLAPGVELLLGGPGASACGEQLAGRGRIVGGAALAGLERWVRGQQGPSAALAAEPGMTPDPGAGPAALEQLLVRLIPLLPRDGRPLLVEPAWGGDHPLWLHLHGLPARQTLEHAEALEQLGPLLRAGLRVRLADPGLCCDARRLSRLLCDLERGCAARLLLEVPDAALDETLVRALERAGLRHLDLDLSATGRGELTADALHQRVQALERAGIAVRGGLTLGAPYLDRPGFDALVDGALAAGVEELSFQRLLVPPGSQLRRPGAVSGELRHGSARPHEVLSHGRADAREILRQARLAADLPPLIRALAGTGLLRVLAREQGSLVELVQGFVEDQLLDREAPLSAAAPERLGGRFLRYLRRGLGLELDPDQGAARLVRPASLSLSWTDDGRRLVTDDATGKTAHVGRSALQLLDGFGQARTIHDACEQLLAGAPPASRQQLRRDLEATLDKLVCMGFLVPAPQGGEADPAPEPPFISLEEFDFHYRMLADRERVEGYRRAIEAAVRPGQHVVEIGTGTGILAVLAARAGARVTAIERYSVLAVAREVARSSGVADRIQFVRGRADLVRLERPGDLLLSELVGNRILNEGLLEATLDARRRLLRPGAGLIPRRLEILAALASTTRMDHVGGAFRELGQRYGVSLEPISRWFEQALAAGQVVWELDSAERQLSLLSAAAPLVSIDLASVARAGFCTSARLEPLGSGLANAVVLSFRLELQPGIELSNADPGHGLHWNSPVYMLPRAVPCRPGAGAPEVRLSYEPHGELRVEVTP